MFDPQTIHNSSEASPKFSEGPNIYFRRALVLVWVTAQNDKLRYGPLTSTLVTEKRKTNSKNIGRKKENFYIKYSLIILNLWIAVLTNLLEIWKRKISNIEDSNSEKIQILSCKNAFFLMIGLILLKSGMKKTSPGKHFTQS